MVAKDYSMLFNSVAFVFLFSPVVFLLYSGIDRLRFKRKNEVLNFLLVAFSLVFYCWGGIKPLWGLLVLIAWNYGMGLLSALFSPRQDEPRASKAKKLVLMTGIVGNVAFFFYFKLFGACISLFNELFHTGFSIDKIVIPIGFSFILFQCISYLLDIWSGKVKPNRNLLDFALYVVFFPKLMQGPIVKYQDMQPYLRNRHTGFPDVVAGLERFIVGLAKKVLLADTLGVTVSSIFSQTYAGMDPATAWLGSILFTLQIYLDFSGYSDMALGIARCFGFRFAENFDFPYSSTSVSEFWRRWHISLGAWFREYLYIPLGGSRKGNVYFNLFVVFLVTGLWHGSTLPYILWGICHGLCVMMEKFLMKRGLYGKIPVFIRWFYVMFVVNLGWVVFQTSTWDMFKEYVKRMLGVGFDASTLSFSFPYFLTPRVLALAGLSILLMVVLRNERVQGRLRAWNERSTVFVLCKYVVLLALFAVSVFGIVSSSYAPFLYFQF